MAFVSFEDFGSSCTRLGGQSIHDGAWQQRLWLSARVPLEEGCPKRMWFRILFLARLGLASCRACQQLPATGRVLLGPVRSESIVAPKLPSNVPLVLREVPAMISVCFLVCFPKAALLLL